MRQITIGVGGGHGINLFVGNTQLGYVAPTLKDDCDEFAGFRLTVFGKSETELFKSYSGVKTYLEENEDDLVCHANKITELKTRADAAFEIHAAGQPDPIENMQYSDWADDDE